MHNQLNILSTVLNVCTRLRLLHDALSLEQKQSCCWFPGRHWAQASKFSLTRNAFQARNARPKWQAALCSGFTKAKGVHVGVGY